MAAYLRIRDAVTALYAAAPALADGRIHANRGYALPIGVVSHVIVEHVQSTPERLFLGLDAPVDWTTTIRTRIVARKDGENGSSEELAEALAELAYARVMADQSLGGLVYDLASGEILPDQDEADASVTVIAWDIQVKHRTNNEVIT